MSDHPVQQLWKWELVSGVLTIILGAIVLAWPGPSILVASTLFAVYLLVAGFAQLFMALTLPRSAGYTSDVVHQRRAVVGAGHPVFPSLW